MFLIGKLFLSSKISLDNGQFKCAVKKKINSLSAIFLHTSPVHLSYHLSVSNQTWTEKRESLVFPFAKNACALLVLIKLRELRFSSVRPIELYRSANPKCDYDTFLSILNYDWMSFIRSVYIFVYILYLYFSLTLFKEFFSSFYNKDK